MAGFVCQRINVTDRVHGGFYLSKDEKGNLATTENVYHFYRRCAKLNGFEPVTETHMKHFLERLEASGILTHETKSYPTRGRTNVYYSKYQLLDLGEALYEFGIKGYGTGFAMWHEDEEFGQHWLK